MYSYSVYFQNGGALILEHLFYLFVLALSSIVLDKIMPIIAMKPKILSISVPGNDTWYVPAIMIDK